MKDTTILSDFLHELGVPHTGAYTDSQFRNMPFKSLFGFSRLLKSYGVDSVGERLSDKSEITSIPVPFLAQKGSGFVIVTNITEQPAPMVDYIYYHERRTLPLDTFLNDFTGVVLLAYPDSKSKEPDYSRHMRNELLEKGKTFFLLGCLVLLAVFGMIYSDAIDHLSLIFLFLTDIAGIAVCCLLMLKSMRIKSHAADRMCGILQKHGCDTVLEQKASSFYGIVRWSDVGMGYFITGTLILLLFPQCWHWLALINGCCLPFTVWSISYQRFRIHAWCTLCVTVQCLLWLQFFCFLFGGWWRGVLPLGFPIVLML